MQRTRYVDISALSLNIGEMTANSLIGYHTFTGYDVTSDFLGKMLTELLKSNDKFRKTMTEIALRLRSVKTLQSDVRNLSAAFTTNRTAAA